MTLRIAVELAGPVSVKKRPRAAINKMGKPFVYPEKGSVKYETQLRYAAQQKMDGRPPTIQPVKVHVEVYLEIMRSWPKWQQEAAAAGQWFPIQKNHGDCDNYLKILDALNGVVWADDAQIVEAHIWKRCGTPRLVVLIETIEPPERPARTPRPRDKATADLFVEAPPL